MTQMPRLKLSTRPSHHFGVLVLLASAHVQCTSDDENSEPMATGGTQMGPGSGGNVATGGTDPGPTPGSGGMTSGSGGVTSGNGGGPVEGCVLDLDCDPEPLPKTGDFGQDCVNRINQFRVGCHCLPPLERWTEAEACAEANAEYDQGTGTPHSGWPDAACSDSSGPLSRAMAGRATNECPRYRDSDQVLDLCLLQMYWEGDDWEGVLGRPPTETDYDNCSGSCYGTYGHFIAMTRERHTKVACGITSSGEIWSVQNFE